MVKKLFVLLVLLIPTTVMAGFQVVEDAPAKPTSPIVPAAASETQVQLPPTSAGSLQLVALTYIGEPDKDIPVITGFGRDLKLSEALKQIVPSGWHAFLKEDMAGAKVVGVNWKGGRRWVEVLDVLANDQNLAIDVDWTKKHLYVGERKEAIVPIKSLPALSLWTLNAGQTVGRELQAWGVKAGWKVIWNMQKDWSVPASTSFSGDFPSAAADVIKTLAINGALVRAQFYDGNKTMVVSGPGVAAQ